MNQKPKTSETLWVAPPPQSEELELAICKRFGVHPIIAKILSIRGFDTLEKIEAFLLGRLTDLHNPYLLLGMDKAIDRIYSAFKKGEKILIYGDNDVDGITATTLLADFLRDLSAPFAYFVPNRSTLKQSLILDAILFARDHNCKLLITVDCGVSAHDEIKEAVKYGIDVIVSDHHEPTDELPVCVATLNPKLINSTYPNKDLTGVGVAFKLIHALNDHLIEKKELFYKEALTIDLHKYLDLVALGTVADMGALTGENRILVRDGLERIKKLKRTGLQELIEVCGIEPSKITPMEIASKIAPRLNSLGRIDFPQKGVDLLMLGNKADAEILAKDLNLKNIERQHIERDASEKIDTYLATHPEIFNERAIVLYSNEWHPGIIPIITARIAKQYNRPTLLIAIEDGVGKGSMRTISKFPLLPILRKNSDILLSFGGHAFAAGMTIEEAHIPAFKKSFIDAANEELKDEDMTAKLYIDAEVEFKDIPQLLGSFRDLEPFGNENPAPLLYTIAEQASLPKTFGKPFVGGSLSKPHLKLHLKQGKEQFIAIGFGMSERAGEVYVKLSGKGQGSDNPRRIAILFTPQINTFNSSIQLLIRDFRVLN